MQAYSVDLRKRVLADSDAGLGTKIVAQKYSVSPAIVRRWNQRRREHGEWEPRRRNSGGRIAGGQSPVSYACCRTIRECIGYGGPRTRPAIGLGQLSL